MIKMVKMVGVKVEEIGGTEGDTKMNVARVIMEEISLIIGGKTGRDWWQVRR